MPQRNPLLQQFLTRAEAAFRAGDIQPEAAAVVDNIFAALRMPGAGGVEAGSWLPVCRYITSALSATRAASGLSAGEVLTDLAAAFDLLEPLLAWKPRPAGGPNASDNWADGHANAMIIGRGGVEERGDVAIGVSLMAPHVRYPDHNHAPEEVYLILSPGRFKHGAADWVEPGIGGTFHNRPHVWHAMASDAAPLLALWFLWIQA